MYLKIDSRLRDLSLFLKDSSDRSHLIIWKRIPNFRLSEGETVSVIVGSGSR